MKKKTIKKDPPDIWSSQYSDVYEGSNYGSGLAGWVMKSSHIILEKDFSQSSKFQRVLEVGAGSGVHFQYIKHDFDEYVLSDFSLEMLRQSDGAANDDRVTLAAEDASKLSYEDSSFDRVIACHVLEHIYKPHEVLQEWYRVLKPGGVLSIVLPCDPGLMWRFGRNFGPRRTAEKNGLPYNYVMAREHVNPITNLVNFIHYYFGDDVSESWWPFRIPSSDINLIYTVNITV